MKKLSVLMIVVAAMLMSVETNAQPPWAKAYGKRNREWRNHYDNDYRRVVVRNRYFYYPSANVYYNPGCNRYWYPRRGAWVQVNALPRDIVVVNQPRYEVYYDGDDVWRENQVHVRRYRPGVRVSIDARF